MDHITVKHQAKPICEMFVWEYCRGHPGSDYLSLKLLWKCMDEVKLLLWLRGGEVVARHCRGYRGGYLG